MNRKMRAKLNNQAAKRSKERKPNRCPNCGSDLVPMRVAGVVLVPEASDKPPEKLH